jgi:hypothetical protein
MEIRFFGFKFRVEILILIVVVWWILFGHTFCGCFNYAFIEGFDSSLNFADGSYNLQDVSGNSLLKGHMLKTQVSAGSSPGSNGGSSSAPLATAALVSKIKNAKTQEGFVGANTNYGQSSPYDLSGDTTINTSSWNAPNMTVVPGQPLNSSVQNIINRPNGPLPLPEGEMLLFADTPFKPECCPNTYSNSSGCACMNTNTYNYLILRGGNNVPYSQY